jgi:hypothetical protein
MFILIPIPVGARHVAAVRGAVWKHVNCTHCRQPYAYLLELEGTGVHQDLLFLDEKGAAERARANAEENLRQKSINCVLPVPCPTCGCYQDDMARRLKDEASTNPVQVVGALIALLALIPLAFDSAYLWVLSLVLAVAGVGVLAYGYVLAFRFDPNAGDPEPRKALGRKHAVYGDPLAELLAESPNAEHYPSSDHIKPA